jgi:hypothetical protein
MDDFHCNDKQASLANNSDKTSTPDDGECGEA